MELYPLFCKIREIMNMVIDILKPKIRKPRKRITRLASMTFLIFTLSLRIPVTSDEINENTYPVRRIRPILSYPMFNSLEIIGINGSIEMAAMP